MDPVEALLPARLGRPFRWLLAATATSSLGGGILLAAGPLLVASQTHDPVLVASAAFLERLPWLLFGLLAGTIVDRVDRRRMVVLSDCLRTVLLVALAATILTGTVSIAAVLVAVFALGTAETFADLAGSTLVPSVVDRADLGAANARVQGAFLLGGQLVGPAVGAVLFAVGAVVPFGVTAGCVLAGAVLVSRMRVRREAVPRRDPERGGGALHAVLQETADGMRWLVHDPAVRTLALTIVLFNVTFGAAWSVLVLWSQQRLGLGEAGFGLLATAGALGGLLGTTSYDWLEAHLSLADIMRIGLVIETLTHLALALVTVPVLALGVMFVFGAHAFVWGTTSTTIRQRSVPGHLLGRVNAVYLLGVQGGLLVGTAIGGVVARWGGITAPFWFACAGSAVLLAALWRELGHIARAAEV